MYYSISNSLWRTAGSEISHKASCILSKLPGILWFVMTCLSRSMKTDKLSKSLNISRDQGLSATYTAEVPRKLSP